MRIILEHIWMIWVVASLCIFISGVESQQTGQSDIPLLNNSDISDFLGEDEGSGEVEPGLYNVTVADSLPHLVVMDSRDKPCLLATLNASMHVSYRVPEGIVHETYIALAEIQLPEDVHAQGVCGENTSRLLLDWGNNTFHVNITFKRKEATYENENDTWAMTGIAVTYNLSDTRVFPGASETQVVALERRGLSLFSAYVGETHMCERDVTVQLGTNERGVVVNFHDVKMAAFDVTSSEFPKSTKMCPEKGQNGDDEDIRVPLIVACCLSAVVVIVVVAYVIGRKVQEARDQTDYRQMQ